MHVGERNGHWLLSRHCTHVPAPPSGALQYGVPPEQFVLLSHWTHWFIEQMVLDVPAQFVLVMHWTHAAFVGLQYGVAPGHSVSLVQPVAHMNDCALQ